MTKDELIKIVENKEEFREFIVNLLKVTPSDSDFEQVDDVPQIGLGYDDGYYWETTTITLADNNTLDVTFDVGSGSGWIECWYSKEIVPIENFRQYLLNRKYNDESVDVIDILKDEIQEMDNAKEIIGTDEESEYWDKGFHYE